MSEQIEILEPEGPSSGRRGRGTAVLVVVAVLVAAVLGGSAYAVYRVFFAGGAQPAEALPASTIGLVTIDLNPSAGQKIEAIKTIRKFPKLKEELGLDADDDLRRFVVDEMIEANECTSLDYDRHIEPWLGKRSAFAAVDLGEDVPAPAVALQVTDKAGAEDGFARIAECASFGEDFGFTVTDDYLIASDSKEHAEKIVAAAGEKPLAEDAGYQRWTEEVGDAGVLSFYVDESAAQVLVDAFDDFGTFPGMPGMPGGIEGDVAPSPEEEDPRALMEEAFKDFEGLAGTVRFADGGMELEVVGTGVDQYTGGSPVGDLVGGLPADTAALLGFSVPEDFVEQVVERVRAQLGDEFSEQMDQQIEAFETETGLAFPEDAQTLLGEALTLSLGGDAPESLEGIGSPADVPFGLVISGEPERIEEVIGKIEEASGSSLGDLGGVQKSGDGRVALASSDAYADDLLAEGELAGSDNFQRAVPEAEKATGVFYLDFDSEWVTAIVDTFGEDTGNDTAELSENLAVLEALGVSAWSDGDTSHFLLKLTTD